jgi:hypothetical protein
MKMWFTDNKRIATTRRKDVITYTRYMYGFNLLTYDTTETVQNNVKSITGRYVRLCTFVLLLSFLQEVEILHTCYLLPNLYLPPLSGEPPSGVFISPITWTSLYILALIITEGIYAFLVILLRKTWKFRPVRFYEWMKEWVKRRWSL